MVITLNLHYKSNKKFSRRCAFTLAELLIVMAIIAVLVGISIPIFMGQLEKSKEATDVANMRAAKSLAVELFYSGVTDKASAQAHGLQWWDDNTTGNNACGVYDPKTGTIKNISPKNWPKDKVYGQGSANDGGMSVVGYDSSVDYTGAVIQVNIYPQGVKASVLKQFNNGAYASMAGKPCIIVEWKNAGGDYVTDSSGKRIGMVIFLDQ